MMLQAETDTFGVSAQMQCYTTDSATMEQVLNDILLEGVILLCHKDTVA